MAESTVRDLVLICTGHKASQVSRSVLNSWCNDTIQDAARRVLELEADMSVLKREILSCQGALVEKEKEWRDADSQLRLQFLEEKLELRRSCVEKELSLRVKHSAERNAVAADLAHCQAMRQAMIGAEECTYQKQAVLALCEAERDFYAAKLGVQKEEPINQHSEEKIQVGSCEYSLTEHQTRVRSLEERLGNCRYAAQRHSMYTLSNKFILQIFGCLGVSFCPGMQKYMAMPSSYSTELHCFFLLLLISRYLLMST